MGIGNIISPAAEKQMMTPHYPSWGLGTRSGARWTATAVGHPHYPSWGLGTPSELRRGLQRRLLITPHGDWELQHRHRRLLRQVRLITPHGDWEPEAAPPSRRRSRSSAHYPSWGIGNTGCSARSRRMSSSPHYPSWGLGTCFRSATLSRRTCSSLPLMGIGNSGGVPPPPPAPQSSLPLMGIGNPIERPVPFGAPP